MSRFHSFASMDRNNNAILSHGNGNVFLMQKTDLRKLRDFARVYPSTERMVMLGISAFALPSFSPSVSCSAYVMRHTVYGMHLVDEIHLCKSNGPGELTPGEIDTARRGDRAFRRQ